MQQWTLHLCREYGAMLAASTRLGTTGVALSTGIALGLWWGDSDFGGGPFAAFALVAILVATLQQTLP